MPNWCENELSIEGPKDDLKVFVDKVADTPKDENVEIINPISICESLLPLPKDAMRMTEDGINVFTDGGYQSAIDLWGTKWGDCDTQMTVRSDSVVVFNFESAWAPPIEAINRISLMFPTLVFKLWYRELGMNFQGHYEIKNGVEADSNYEEDISDEELKEIFGDDEDDGDE